VNSNFDNSFVSKKAKIGKNSIIKIGSIVEDDCVIGDNCIIGPYAHIHSHSQIGDNCVIGNFVEIKNSQIGNECKAKHLTYIGDCKCGDRVNFGCGVVIANYNGKEKNYTIIKDDVFIGSNSNLIAPLTIGSKSFIAAGSSVSKKVNDFEFVIERSEEIHKLNKLEF
jgi:bifunctional UDP-N-acetylglucosamine pyrophosphorylase/glucosamine-1-phosphate N-acetyltransferase